MRDQSWCASCGAGMLYTEDENATCYKCDQEEYNKLETRYSKFMEYAKLHFISLMQDLESLEERMEKIDPNCKDYAELDFEFNWVSGQITATRHLMSVASDILGIQTEEK